MESFIKADIFFFITSIAVAVFYHWHDYRHGLCHSHFK